MPFHSDFSPLPVKNINPSLLYDPWSFMQVEKESKKKNSDWNSCFIHAEQDVTKRQGFAFNPQNPPGQWHQNPCVEARDPTLKAPLFAMSDENPVKVFISRCVTWFRNKCVIFWLFFLGWFELIWDWVVSGNTNSGDGWGIINIGLNNRFKQSALWRSGESQRVSTPRTLSK